MSLAGVKIVFVLTISAIAFTAVGSTDKAGARAAPPQQTKAAETVRSVVEPAARAFVADPRAAGLSIGVLRGDETFSGHFGNLERGKKSPPDDRTVYPIASANEVLRGQTSC